MLLTAQHGVGLVTKAGSFGNKQSLMRAVSALRAFRDAH